MLGDLVDALLGFDSAVLNSTSILCFIGVATASAYILERNPLNQLPIGGTLAIAGVIALVVTIIMNVLVFIPISKMGTSTAFDIHELEGQTGILTDAIAVDGIGEVLITTPITKVSKYAKSMTNEAIGQGETVLIISVEENTLIVRRYNNNIVDGMPTKPL
jgi:membrane protein implicated in regulation of membrane protease activity